MAALSSADGPLRVGYGLSRPAVVGQKATPGQEAPVSKAAKIADHPPWAKMADAGG